MVRAALEMNCCAADLCKKSYERQHAAALVDIGMEHVCISISLYRSRQISSKSGMKGRQSVAGDSSCHAKRGEPSQTSFALSQGLQQIHW